MASPAFVVCLPANGAQARNFPGSNASNASSQTAGVKPFSSNKSGAQNFLGFCSQKSLFSKDLKAGVFVHARQAIKGGNGLAIRMAIGAVEKTIIEKYFSLPQKGSVQAEYIWIDGSGENVRSKTKTLTKALGDMSELPNWNFDGSSTGQAPGNDSEVILKPQAIFPDPFRGGDNVLVMCDCYTPAGEPIPSNTRYHAAKVFEKSKDLKPWFGIEQEYTLFSKDNWPLGWPTGGYPGPQGPYYCGAGYDRVFGRELAEAHYRACLYAGIKISGINAEVMPGQWEFQVGPAEGIEAGDSLWVARYLMQRISEELGVIVSFDPKPIQGDWNGAGCHTNFSTETMRQPGGFEEIKKAIERLEEKHMEHIAIYGKGNERRLTGLHETAPITKFSWGVANRGASIRIPRETEKLGCGYLEDRRPASNMDPYVVTAKLVETACQVTV